MDDRCKNCHYGTVIGSCDYILIEGKARGCEPGTHCTKFKSIVTKAAQRDAKVKAVPGGAPGRKRQIALTYAEYDRVFRPLYDKGETDYQISIDTGFCRNTVFRWRKTLGLPCNAVRKSETETCRKRRTLWQKGYTDRQIAEELDEPVTRVTAWRNRIGLRVNPDPRCKNVRV